MSVRYTLRLVEHGAEVWKRWTGDREEALRDLAATLPDLDVDQHRAVNFLLAARDIDLDGVRAGTAHTIVVHTKDLATRLELEARQKGHSMSSE